MQIIQKGDTVFISESPNISKYKNAKLGWSPRMAEHLGKSGKVDCIGRPFGEEIIVRVELQDPQIGSSRRTFSWFLEDVSLHPRSKWRRQSNL